MKRRIRTPLFYLLIATLAFSLPGTMSSAKGLDARQRSETKAYEGSGLVVAGVHAHGICASSDGLNCVQFTRTSGERYVRVAISNDLGVQSPGAIGVQGAQGEWTLWQPFCGEIDEPVRIDHVGTITVYVYSGTCGNLAGATTGGTITATFSRRP